VHFAGHRIGISLPDVTLTLTLGVSCAHNDMQPSIYKKSLKALALLLLGLRITQSLGYG